jgi:hypothetical protein
MPDAALSDPARRSVRRIVDSRAVGSTSYLDVDLAVESAGGRLGLYARSLWATSVIPACELLPLGHAFDDLGAQRVTFRIDVQYDRTLRHQWLRADGTVRTSLAAEWPGVRDGLEAS